MSEIPFTFSQYLIDVRDNAKQFLAARTLRLRNNARIIAMVANDEEINASAMQTSKDQFLIRVNDGLLRKCFEILDPTAREYYQRNMKYFDVSEELFVRTVCGAASEMVFWHEFAHIARGHMDYLRAQGLLEEYKITESELKSGNGAVAESDSSRIWQFVELDADIYGAQFLLARVVTILASHRNRIAYSTLLRAFALGVRGMYEALYQAGYTGHFDELGGTHPHPLSRAYVAFTHGLAGASRLGVSDDIADEWCKVSQAALLEYELEDLRSPIDGSVLAAFADSRLQEWHKTEAVLEPYQLLHAPIKISWRKKLRQFMSCRLVG